MNPELIDMLKETVNMFAFLAFELTLLFIVISYLVGILQEFVPPQKVQSILSARNGRGYFIAALLGSITPFCSCSTIPFLKGLLRARAGFGPMMVFLFASPLLNPIIIGLFVVTFSIKVALFYFIIAMGVSVIAGFVLEKLGFERYVRKEAYAQNEIATSCCNVKVAPALNTSCCDTKPTVTTSCCSTKPAPVVVESCCDTITLKRPSVESRWLRIWRTTWSDFKQVLPYLFAGVLLGSFIYGFIPTDLIAQYAGDATWYAIPIAAVIGIPLYIRAEAVIPLSAVLVQKGMAMGSVMALIIGSAGASITEVILLKSIFKNQMIAAFLCVILSMATISGFLYWLFFS
ncbi:permease [Shewanella algae]|uniref:permease n=1 Tax=Shewanella algae TaxID=38313 RepID=UPI001AAD7EFE|nr:permease [Shewanella algae]MBO2583531.1 permease [Shewanella algae]MBO2687333.1 permease [Shewanella algae]